MGLVRVEKSRRIAFFPLGRRNLGYVAFRVGGLARRKKNNKKIAFLQKETAEVPQKEKKAKLRKKKQSFHFEKITKI